MDKLEVFDRLDALRAMKADRLARGDASGARYSDKHIGTWWRKLASQEQLEYAQTRGLTPS